MNQEKLTLMRKQIMKNMLKPRSICWEVFSIQAVHVSTPKLRKSLYKIKKKAKSIYIMPTNLEVSMKQMVSEATEKMRETPIWWRQTNKICLNKSFCEKKKKTRQKTNQISKYSLKLDVFTKKAQNLFGYFQNRKKAEIKIFSNKIEKGKR